MIQLRPDLKFVIDHSSRDYIFCRTFLWVGVLIIIMFMGYRGPQQFITKFANSQQCTQNSTNRQQNETEITCIIQFDVNDSSITQIQTQIWLQVNRTGLLENRIIFHKPNKNQISYDFLPPMKFSLKVLASIHSRQMPQSNDQLQNTSIKNELNQSKVSRYSMIYDSKEDDINFGCFQSPQNINVTNKNNNNKGIECLSNIFEEFEVNYYKTFTFIINLQTLKYTDGIEQIKLLIIYENEKFHKYNILFKIIFFFFSLYSLRQFNDKLGIIPKQHWFNIHKWIYYLLKVSLVYNLPFQLLSFLKAPILQEVLDQLTQQILTASLYYFWLSNFEILHRHNQTDDQDENQSGCITKWNVFKLFVIVIYTFPQAIMSIFIFIQKENHSQYDPSKQIPLYPHYVQFQIGCLIVYSIIFCLLSMKFLKSSQRPILTDIQDQIQNKDNQYNKHDPFSDELQGSAILPVHSNEGGNFQILLLFSIIVFAIDSMIRVQNFLYPLKQTSFNIISEAALLNVYLVLINTFYLPHSIVEQTDTLETSQQEIEVTVSHVYGDIELEQQHNESPIVDKQLQYERENLWMNIQKQLEDENHNLDSE